MNYGRENIAAFLEKAAPFVNVIDLGAGSGADLEQAAAICPEAERFAVESFPPNVEQLKLRHNVFPLNLEKDPIPLVTRPSTSS